MLVDKKTKQNKLDMNQQRALVAQPVNCILSCIKKKHGEQIKGGDSPLLLCSLPRALHPVLGAPAQDTDL